VLAWFEDTAPAIIEHSFGAGRVLVFNTTANDEWSDLPRRNSFLPLLDQAVRRLAHDRLQRSYPAGEMVAFTLPGLGAHGTVTIKSPSGRQLSPALQQLNGQTIARLDSADEAGVYLMSAQGEKGRTESSFVVQAGRGDSIVTKAETGTLRSWWGPVPLEVVHPNPAAPADEAAAGRRVLLWPWLLALGALALLAETWLVHRLCPAANPAVASSVVARHGILAPTAKPEVAV
jgi:hypothetical protein